MAKFIETELGLEKECITCKEHYPASKEFFYGISHRKKDGTQSLEANCKDCYKQRFKPWIKKTYNVAYRYVGV